MAHPSFGRALLAAVLGVLALASRAAPAEDLEEASRLHREGQQVQALERVEAYLASRRKDPQGRFLKGLILAEQKKTAEAIQVFTSLTEEFPELPEPYNNLAVLYASLGQYDKARSALELAIQAHPGYATAHENLGDIYAQLAVRQYEKTLELDRANTTAQTKLMTIRRMLNPGNPTGPVPAVR